MPKRIGVVTRDVLIDATLPPATTTYTVISHEFAINTAKRLLSENGFTIVNERYTCNEGARVASGVFHLLYGDDPDLGMMFSFSNSYDKSLRFRCAVGGYVKINNTSIISNTSSWGRKHTGNADQETVETIEDQISNAKAYYKQLQSDKEQMKLIPLTKRQFAELLGTLYIDIKMVSTEQLGMIKKEFEKPSFNYDSDADSLWTLYNHILLALAKSHPRTWMEQQRLVHFHLMTEFNLTEFDDEELDTPEVPGVLNGAVDAEAEERALMADAYLEDVAEGEYPEVTEEEANQLLHGVNNNEEDITMTVPAEDEETVVMTDEDVAEAPRDLDAEEDADADAVLTEIPQRIPVPTETIPIEQSIPDVDVDGREPVAECFDCGHVREECICEAKEQALTEERLAELNQEIDNGAVGPVVMQAVESVEGVTNADSGDIADETFLMEKKDLEEMYPDDKVEEGLLVTIGEDQCQVVGEDGDCFILCEVSSDEEVMSDVVKPKSETIGVLPVAPQQLETPAGEGVSEEVVETSSNTDPIESVVEEPTQIGMDFEIGSADESAPAETMLRTPESEMSEEEVDKLMQGIEKNAPIVLSSEEQVLHDTISNELNDIYGEVPKFTYELKEGQYNISLESGEVIVLTHEYINDLQEDV